MDTKRRRARFIAWFRARYAGLPEAEARKRFMNDAKRHGDEKLTKGRVSQLFNETQSFGELAAKTLAIRLGLPEDYFLVGEADSAQPTDTDWPLSAFVTREQWLAAPHNLRIAAAWEASKVINPPPQQQEQDPPIHQPAKRRARGK